MSEMLDPTRDVTLLLTASINPNGMASAAGDADSRRNDYLTALEYYLTQHPTVGKVALVDNSGSDLTAFHDLVARLRPRAEVELISFAGNNFPRELGKSYGELTLIHHAMAHSRLIASGSHVVKITGRIFVRNLTEILRRTPKRVELSVDLRDHPFYDILRMRGAGHYSDTRMFVVTPGLWARRLLGQESQLCDGLQGLRPAGKMVIEDLFFEVSKRAKAEGERVSLRFPIEPIYSGIAGHLSKSYDSPRERRKRAVRGLARRLAPWFKF